MILYLYDRYLEVMNELMGAQISPAYCTDPYMFTSDSIVHLGLTPSGSMYIPEYVYMLYGVRHLHLHMPLAVVSEQPMIGRLLSPVSFWISLTTCSQPDH